MNYKVSAIIDHTYVCHYTHTLDSELLATNNYSTHSREYKLALFGLTVSKGHKVLVGQQTSKRIRHLISHPTLHTNTSKPQDKKHGNKSSIFLYMKLISIEFTMTIIHCIVRR